jgi:glycosyltransferase involved in cell wall biosynthesis
MTRLLVSVVTPSYNQAAFLEATIRSVLEQDYEPIEYVVVDGGSVDGSVEIIRRHEGRLAWWTSEPDDGQAQAINKGFAHTSGQLLAYLNSDDTLLAGAISRLVAVLEAEPELVAAYGDALWLDEEGRTTAYAEARSWEPVPMLVSGSARLHQPSSLWRRSAWERIGGFEESLHYTFDTLFFIRLAALGPARHVREPLAGYRLHPSSKTYSEPPAKLDEYVRLGDEHLIPARLPAPLRRHSRRARASYYRRAALGWYNAGELGRARRLVLRSLTLSPQMSLRTARHLAPALLPEPVIRLRRRLRKRRHAGVA